jgi:hypothetical protein
MAQYGLVRAEQLEAVIITILEDTAKVGVR